MKKTALIIFVCLIGITTCICSGATEMLKIRDSEYPIAPREEMIERGFNIPDIPLGENAADYYIEAMNKYARIDNNDKPLNAMWDYALDHGWTDQFSQLESWLAENNQAWELIVKGSQKKQCWFPLLNEPDTPLSGILLPYLSDMREFARHAKIRGKYYEFKQAHGEALNCYLTAYSVGFHAGQQPFLINMLVGIAVQAVAGQPVHDFISNGHAAATDLDNIIAHLGKFSLRYEHYRNSMSAEKLFGTDAIQFIMADPEFANAFGVNTRLFVLLNTFTGLPKVVTETHFRMFWEKFDEWLDKPVAEAIKIEDFDYEFIEKDLPKWSLGRTLLPALSKSRIRFACCQAYNSLLVVEALLHKYMLQTGNFPQTIEELKQLYGELPQDPFSEEDFKYIIENDIYKLYSVGQNLVDDGGAAEKDKSYLKTLDIVLSNQPTPEPPPFEGK